jgi:hypothetical protein
VKSPFVYEKHERRLVLITHGFINKRDRTPKEEITRAWRIHDEDQNRATLAIVRKVRR